MIKTLKIETIFKNKFIELQNNIVLNKENLNTFKHIKLIENDSSEPGSVVLCKYNEKFLFLKNYRYGINEYCWELPRGYKSEHENLKECAIRELKEETNINISENDSIKKIGEFVVNSSIMASKVSIFFIELHKINELIFQKEEHISEHQWLTIDEITNKIRNNEINDAFSINAFMFYILRFMKIQYLDLSR